MDSDDVALAIELYAAVARKAFDVEALLRTLEHDAGVDYTLSPGIGNEIRQLVGGASMNKLQREALHDLLWSTLIGYSVRRPRAEPYSREQRACIAFLSVIASIGAAQRNEGDREWLFMRIIDNAHWWTEALAEEDVVARVFRRITGGLLGMTTAQPQ